MCRNPGFQRAARAHVDSLLADLERDLAARSIPGLVHGAFSLADVLWGVNLVRMNYLGLSSMWDERPRVKDYVGALVRRPSLFEEAVRASVDSMPPSAYMDAIANG